MKNIVVSDKEQIKSRNWNKKQIKLVVEIVRKERDQKHKNNPPEKKEPKTKSNFSFFLGFVERISCLELLNFFFSLFFSLFLFLKTEKKDLERDERKRQSQLSIWKWKTVKNGKVLFFFFLSKRKKERKRALW